MTLNDVLTPAIELAEVGFPVSPVSAGAWAKGEALLKSGVNGDEMLLNGRAPMVILHKQIFKLTFFRLEN